MTIHPLVFMHDVVFVRSQLRGRKMTDASESIYDQHGGCTNIGCSSCPFADMRARIDLCTRQMAQYRVAYDGFDMCSWRMKILCKIKATQ